MLPVSAAEVLCRLREAEPEVRRAVIRVLVPARKRRRRRQARMVAWRCWR
jgi:hypothetical protein